MTKKTNRGITDELPDDNIFHSVDIAHMEAARVASIVENYFYTDRSVTRASRDFLPRADDVILATNPRTGDQALLRIIRLINARDDEEFEQVVRVVNSDSVPWIESRFVDGNPDILNADQPGSRRIFKTHMAAQGLNVKGRKKSPLFVTIARHPVDVRVSWFNYIRDCYRVGGNDARTQFEQIFEPDDFVDVTATNAQINPLAKILTLEHIMIDWYLESKKNKRVFQVFYEQLITAPQKVIKDLSEFLEASLTPARVERIAQLILKERLVPDMSTRDRADTVAETNGLRFSWYGYQKMVEKWTKGIASAQAPKDFGNTYEEFYYQALGERYPFPKQYHPKPPGKGPLDKIGRDIEAAVKKCVIM
jgi:hypothetical protein